MSLTLVPLALAGCAEAGRPALAVSTSSPFMDAARLAVDDAISAGTSVSFDTLMAGEQSNVAAPAIGAAREFVSRPRLIAVVGHSNSSASLAASQIYNEAGVVQLAPHSSAVLYSEAGPYSFRLVPPDDLQASYLADHVRESLGPGAGVAVVYVNDDYGRGLRSLVDRALTERSIRNVLEIPYVEEPVQSRDTGHAAEAIATAAPDAILWLGRASALEEYLPVLRSVVPTTPIIGTDGLATARHLITQAGDWSDVRHVDFLELGATPDLEEFASRYEQRFGRPATVPDALTYDAVRLAVAGMEAGSVTGADLRDYLASLGRTRPAYAGITGPIQFDERGDVVRGYVMVTLP